MQEKKSHKIFIVSLSNTLPYPKSINIYIPNAMVIKFWYTHFTNITVFWSGWLRCVASCAFIIRFIHYPIIMFFMLLDKVNTWLLCYLSWRDWTGFVVHPETYSSHYIGYDYLYVWDIFVRHMLKYSSVRVSNKPIFY